MKKYGILIIPKMKSFYKDNLATMAKSELILLNRGKLEDGLTQIEYYVAGNMSFITFGCNNLESNTVQYLETLSYFWGLFELKEDGEMKWIPSEKKLKYDEDLVTSQQYSGKTHEVLAEQLINIAHYASKFLICKDQGLSFLDPMCGKGTLLHVGLRKGYNTIGFENDLKAFDNYEIFLKEYLQQNKIKHKAAREKIKINRVARGSKLQVEVSANKEEFKKGIVQKLVMFQENCKNILDYLKRESIPFIVIDLGAFQAGLFRNKLSPLKVKESLELVEVLQVLSKSLMSGGALSIAYDTTIISRTEFKKLLQESQLEVMEDQDIDFQFHENNLQRSVREIIVATKK